MVILMKILGPQGTVTDVKLSLSPAESIDQLTTTLRDNANALAQRTNAAAQGQLALAQSEMYRNNAALGRDALSFQEKLEATRLKEKKEEEDRLAALRSESSVSVYAKVPEYNRLGNEFYPSARNQIDNNVPMTPQQLGEYDRIAKEQYTQMGVFFTDLKDYRRFDQWLRNSSLEHVDNLIKYGSPMTIAALVKEYHEDK